jgi:hypothetical protein
VISIEYKEPPYPDDLSVLRIRNCNSRSLSGYGIKWVKEDYIEHRRELFPCPAGWFFTSNASAPLAKIVEVNGFPEIADLTREEDILMGLALESAGWKFRFVDSPDISVYHMVHDFPEFTSYKRYKDVSYRDLGWETVEIDGMLVEGGGGKGKCGLNTNSDEIQLVTKDVFNTKYPGSWGLIEYYRRKTSIRFNEEIGFNLARERERVLRYV